MSYELEPCITLSDNYTIYDEMKIYQTLRNYSKLLIEVYPGVDRNVVKEKLKIQFIGYTIVDLENSAIDKSVVQKSIMELGNDRIFTRMKTHDIADFYKADGLKEVNNIIASTNKVIVLGVGVSLLKRCDCLLVHIGLPRWEIQANYRQGLATWQQDNSNLENSQKFKMGYFFDWRIADKIKVDYIDSIDYLIDFSDQEMKMVSRLDYREILKEVTAQPFRLKPFFDPGVWGGQWMKEKFGLDRETVNFAWSFDGVPEENSIQVKTSETKFVIPGIDIVLFEPLSLLGKSVYEKYGSEFPIRFDMLDTIGGQNLSLQVHPDKKYMLEQFGLKYTQEESYYILDTNGDFAYVYIGLKDGVSNNQFFSALEEAYSIGDEFEVEKYINKIKCKKGDHFLIPSGTIHCSGSDVMVLEISQTPYIFTFKLWDWNRVDLNGVPRPINLEHGKKVVNNKYNNTYVNKYLYNNFQIIDDDKMISGLAEGQDIVTSIYEHCEQVSFDTNNKFQMINLVDGDSLEVISDSGKFSPFELNEFETLILPASIGRFSISSPNGKEIKYVHAEIR